MDVLKVLDWGCACRFLLLFLTCILLGHCVSRLLFYVYVVIKDRVYKKILNWDVFLKITCRNSFDCVQASSQRL